MIIELIELMMIIRLMILIDEMISIDLKFQAVQSFDLESLRTAFCSISLHILSDLEISRHKTHV